MVVRCESSNQHFALKTLLCGGLAGVAAKTIIAPFDRVKIHFQIQNPTLVAYSGRIGGVFGALKSIYQTTGLTGLYRGHPAMIVRIFPYAAINFYSYEFFKESLYHGRPPGDVAWWRRLLAGSLSGAMAVTLTYPLDIIRTRLAFDLTVKSIIPNFSFQRVVDSYLKIVGRVVTSLLLEGGKTSSMSIAGLYQGYLATLVGIIPYAGVSYFSFESMKLFYLRYASEKRPTKIPVWLKLPMGMVAGALAQTAAYPLDIVRRRAQVLRIAPHLREIHQADGLSPFRMLVTIVRKRGFRGLFTGLSINYLKVAPATGISFVIYEFLKEHVFRLPVI